jgi:hypothetical protein
VPNGASGATASLAACSETAGAGRVRAALPAIAKTCVSHANWRLNRGVFRDYYRYFNSLVNSCGFWVRHGYKMATRANCRFFWHAMLCKKILSCLTLREFAEGGRSLVVAGRDHG